MGEVDNLTTLLPEDDAVYVKWGEKWKIPAIEDWIELSDNCYKLWTNNYKNTEVAGLIFFKCKNESERGVFSTFKDTTRSEYNEMYDIHIFLPAAGYKFDDYVTDMENYGDYWSASLVKDSPGDAWIIFFSAHGVYSREINRKFGHTVRPVRSK